MKTKFLLLLLIAISFSCTEDDGTASTITCIDNTYFALSTSDMQNTNNVIDVLQNTTANITTSSFTINGGIGTGITPLNHPSAWDKVNRQFIWFDQEEAADALVYDEATNFTTNLTLPNSSWGFLGRISAPVYLNGTLYVLDQDVNPASPRFNIHTMNPSTGTLGPILATGGLIPGTAPFDLTNTYATATSNNVDKLYFRVGTEMFSYDVNTAVLNIFNSLPLNGTYHSGLEYNQTKDVFYVLTGDNLNVDLVELEFTLPNNFTATTLYSGVNVNVESMQLEWKECGKRLHAISHFNFGNPSTQAQTEIIEFNLDASPSFVTQSFNGFIFGFVHKEL
ncbi:MAG: hypothetical protein ACSHWW_09625 [Nonlabens sp.]|uniref:hypothetical protein n=1 Tax=Nonlabens sp. TaxID=1888209 RepID=UPI003EF1C323